MEYVEYLFVPAESTTIDFPTYVQMVTDYTNRTNSTLANVSASAAFEFSIAEARRRYFGTSTLSPAPAPPPHLGNPHRDAAFLDESGARVELPLVVRDNQLKDEYFIAGKTRGDPANMSPDHLYRADCGGEEANIVKMYVRILLQSTESREDFFMRMYGATFDAAFKRFDVRACFTEHITNLQLERDPAPSPPPPNNWVIPPSPPAYAYEMLTLSVATSGSAIFFLMGCICCVAVGGHAARGRHSSRFPGTKNERVDRMPYAKEDYEKRGEAPSGPFRPDLKQPARRLNTGFSFSGMNLAYNSVDQ